MKKHEWRKDEKAVYQPKTKPELLELPEYKYIVIDGEGSPETEAFAECITALYSVAYTIKMTLKKDPPPDYYDYTVYPLEGIWSLNDEAIKNFNGTIHKEDFVYNLMIRQPDYLTEEIINEKIALARKKKQLPGLDKVRYQTISDGKCVQMMHIGSFDAEPESFAKMEDFAEEQGLQRASKMHREIYISDFRKVPEAKRKTILRFWVE